MSGLEGVKGEGMGETLKGDDGALEEEKRTEDRGSWEDDKEGIRTGCVEGGGRRGWCHKGQDRGEFRRGDRAISRVKSC